MMRLQAQAKLLALVATTAELDDKIEWYRIADVVEDAGLDRLLSGDWTGYELEETHRFHEIAQRVTPEKIDEAQQLIESHLLRGNKLVTVLDTDYPTNLREIYNRPPFLFIRGQLTDADNRSVAVVGARDASEGGLREAAHLARELARAGVTVLSGLARGIDTAAHVAALDFGGRTVAVLGTGIDQMYPPENADLAARVAAAGAVVSQFWPSAPPTRWSFPMRNVVMSGLAAGTVVVEATRTSGAKMQARLALDHGKQVFLIERLVLTEEWAQKYAQRPGATVVRSVDDILETLVDLARPVEQLRLG